MATYTSYLNLEKPTTSETFNLLKFNQNWDKIDQGVSALNSNLLDVNVQVLSSASDKISLSAESIVLRAGRICQMNFRFTTTDAIPGETDLCILPDGFRPRSNVRVEIERWASYDKQAQVTIYNGGAVRLNTALESGNQYIFTVVYIGA